MQQERLGFLDFIKGVAIILVVFCHQVVIPQESVVGAVCMMLVCCAVPCFMMCSGYVLLFKEEDPKRSFVRAGHVYIGMVIWRALYMLFSMLFQSVELDAFGLIRYLFLFGTLKGVETEHFWFLQAYLPALLITPLFAPLFCQRKHGAIAGFVALAYLSNQFVMSANLLIQLASSHLGFPVFDLEMLSNIFPFGGEYSSMLVCYLLGGVMRLLDEKRITSRPFVVPLSILCAVGGLAGMLCVRYLQMGSFAWRGKLLVAQYEWTSTLVMSLGMFVLLRRVGHTRPALWIGRQVGRHTMGLYYLHYFCLIPLVQFVYPMLPTALWVNFAKTAVVTVVCVLVTKWGKKAPLIMELLR